MRLNRGRNMAALIEEEGLDENGQPVKGRSTTRRQSKRKVKSRKTTNISGNNGDNDNNSDDNYLGSHSDHDSDAGSGSSLKGDSDIEMISNDEVCILCHSCAIWY